MTSLLIKNCRRYDALEDGPLCSCLVEDGRIAGLGDLAAETRADEVLDGQGCILSPGLIDVHVQGAGGADVLDATPEAMQTLSRTCARFGVTSFLATTVYMPGRANRHLRVAAECTDSDLGGAHLLGTHLEGPFISTEKRGMIQPASIAQPSTAILEDIQSLLAGTLRMMTIAPELPNGLGMIKALLAQGVVASLGHTKATYEQALAGFEAGIDHVTHLFNAMPLLHHRDPGPLAAIFERPTVTCQVITDGVHSHPSVLRLAYQALGPQRFVTITDGMQAMGLPEGKYVYNGITYESRGGAARYRDGTLIGTALGLNQMLGRLVQSTGCTRATAIRTATVNPAQVLGLGRRKGGLMPGMDADLAIFRPDLSVFAAIVAGRIVYHD